MNKARHFIWHNQGQKHDRYTAITKLLVEVPFEAINYPRLETNLPVISCIFLNIMV